MDFLEDIYDRHATALFGFLTGLTRDDAETKDALQEVFCRLASRPGLLKGVENERSFLFRMAHRLVIDRSRRREVRRRHAEPAPLFAAAEDPDEQFFRDSLATALAQLPVEQRVVVHLKLWEDLTFAAIAEVLSISQNTAASRYRYGLDKIREVLRPIYEEIR